MIRPATPADAPAIAAIYEPYVTASVASFEEHPPSPTQIERRIAAALRWIVCEVDGAVIGYAYARPFNPRAAYRWSCEVSIYLATTAHRAGHGRSLATHLLGELRDAGYVNAIAGITLPNNKSVGLFEALGFAHVGTFPGIGHKEGAWHDVGYWQLALREASTPPPTLATATAIAPPGDET